MNREIKMIESFRLLAKNIVTFFENNLLTKFNISCSELAVLKLLCENEGVNITEVALSLRITKSAASQLVSKLERKGFVKRNRNIFDKKVNCLYATEIAKQQYIENSNKYNDVIKEVADKMGEEDSNELSRLLEKLSGVIYSLEEAK